MGGQREDGQEDGQENGMKESVEKTVPSVRGGFAGSAGREFSDFRDCLDAVIGIGAGAAAEGFFARAGLPVPRHGPEFVVGTEGALVFLDACGIVIRVEKEKPDYRGHKILRIDDSRWALRPLGAFRAGPCVIEICPGCHTAAGAGKDELLVLKERLAQENISLWDFKGCNVGRLPLKTKTFPQGLPVVIDRGSMEQLSAAPDAIRTALERKAARAGADPQEKLYAPLRAALSAAAPDGQVFDPAKMRDFWALCAVFAKKGKLVAGWQAGRMGYPKESAAADAGAAYGARLARTGGIMAPGVPPKGKSL